MREAEKYVEVLNSCEELGIALSFDTVAELDKQF